jgi:hypothetical protein
VLFRKGLFRICAKGATLVEVFITIGILAVVLVSFGALLKMMTRTTVSSWTGTQSSLKRQILAARFEPDMYSANEIQVASSTVVQFICDINRTPGYDPDALSVNGIAKKLDTDIDGDAHNTPVAGFGWKSGMNVKDDDDDNDGNIDMRMKIWFSTSALYRDYSVNEEAWGAHQSKITDGILSWQFSYFGSKDSQLGSYQGATLDTNGDGIITATEIDAVAGNNSGSLDIRNERIRISSIRIHADIDSNKDGKADGSYDVEINPPFLAVKPL